MAKTQDTIGLQKGAIAPAQTEQTSTKKAVILMETLLSTPTLPTGTSISPTLQTVQTGELQTTPGVTGTIAATTPTTTTAPTITTATAPTANNAVVRVVGYCLHATNGNIWFNPDGTFVEVTA